MSYSPLGTVQEIDEKIVLRCDHRVTGLLYVSFNRSLST
jgi:hypothetical protein